jgi:hypothetical protein
VQVAGEKGLCRTDVVTPHFFSYYRGISTTLFDKTRTTVDPLSLKTPSCSNPDTTIPSSRVEAGKEDCATLRALEDVFFVVSRRNLALLRDISVIDLVPYTTLAPHPALPSLFNQNLYSKSSTDI